MNRRHFVAGLAGIGFAVALATSASAGQSLAYKPGMINEALAAGKTVFVDYATDWCTTCAAQKRAIKALRAENPAYDKKMLFVRVDWDKFSGHAVATSRNIPRRSTLVLLRGDKELGRIVAGTGKSVIKGLMDKAL